VNAYQKGDSRILEFGSVDDPNQLVRTEGIEFSIENEDINAGGIYQWVQLISSVAHVTYTGGATSFTTNGPVLDTKYPYLLPINDQDKPTDTPTESVDAGDPDHPLMDVSDIDSITREDYFEMYLMWKWTDDNGDSFDAIWVPLCVMAWHWEGGASEDQNHVWELDYGSADHGPSVDTTEYPAWTANYKDFEAQIDDD
jgi:hypothetical protein